MDEVKKEVKKTSKKKPVRIKVEKPKKTEPILEEKVIIPVTYREHIEAGWVNIKASESLQGTGGKVTEIKNIEGKTLHKIKE